MEGELEVIQTTVVNSNAKRFLAESSGSAASEYAILLALLVVISIGAIAAIGGYSMGVFSGAAGEASKTTSQSGGFFGPVISTQSVTLP